MTPKEFVEAFYKEKEDLLQMYLDKDRGTDVGKLVETLNLSADKKRILQRILNQTLTDGFYTVLLGLDGAASIGDRQEMYKLFDENGIELTGGEIEGYAWEYFHGQEKTGANNG